MSHRAAHRALSGLAGVSQAGAARLGGAGRAVATLSVAVAETSQRRLGYVRDRVFQNTMTTALSGFATGLALVLIATGLLGRPAVPPDRTPPITVRASPEQGPRITPSVKATSLHSGLPSGPIAEVRHSSAASPAGGPEVVAIRFGVIDRSRPDWTWSWRVTIHTPNDTARVNARIEYIEFQGSTRRLVGYEELCNVRVASDRIQSIEGIRKISAADSRRISTMTATVSAVNQDAESTTCRPRSAGGRTPFARGSQLGV